MSSVVTYPGTAQEMLDRLVADRSFRVRTIVADNFPAVKARHDDAFANGNPTPYTPEGLTSNLLFLTRQADKHAIIDQVLDVPYRGTAGSRVLTDAMAMGSDMAVETGMSGSGTAFGIMSVVRAIQGIGDGSEAENAAGRVVTKATTEHVIADAEALAKRQRTQRWAIGIGLVLALIITLIILRKR